MHLVFIITQFGSPGQFVILFILKIQLDIYIPHFPSLPMLNSFSCTNSYGSYPSLYLYFCFPYGACQIYSSDTSVYWGCNVYLKELFHFSSCLDYILDKDLLTGGSCSNLDNWKSISRLCKSIPMSKFMNGRIFFSSLAVKYLAQ